MMFFWSSYPFIRYSTFLIVGIILGRAYPGHGSLAGATSVVVLIGLFVVFLYRPRLLINYNWLYGILISGLFLIMGFLVTGNFIGKESHVYSDVEAFRAIVVTDPQQRNSFQRMEVRLTGVRTDRWEQDNQKILLYVKDSTERFQYGDVLLVRSDYRRIRPPANPGMFNFKSFMANKRVYSQAFVALEDVRLIGREQGNPVLAASFAARDYAERLLTMFISNRESLSIAKALVLGVKTDIDTDTRSLYADTGVMHILAVSGLHVGILYILILMMLGQRVNHVTKPILVATIAIPLLWGYAFITGLSPSVLRAVTMFSLIALALAVKRKSNVVNTVAVSAFLLLIINPLMLFSVGFQLSYLAVFGIILIYPRIIKLYTPGSSLTYKVWQLVAISIAAQLATLPLSLFYFHRFPTYFLVGNIMAVPAAMLIVWLGLALIIGGTVAGSIGLVIGQILSVLIQGLNWLLAKLLLLPMANISDISLSGIEVILIYSLIGILLLWWINRQRVWLIMGGFAGLTLVVMMSYTIVQENNKRSIVFYSLSGHWAIDLISNGEVKLICDDRLWDNPEEINYQIMPNREQRGLSDARHLQIATSTTAFGKIVSFYGRQILVMEEIIDESRIPAFIDYAVVGRERYRGGSGGMVFNKVICFAGSADPVIHNLQKQGALVIDL
jgi:competence protein ComEC